MADLDDLPLGGLGRTTEPGGAHGGAVPKRLTLPEIKGMLDELSRDVPDEDDDEDENLEREYRTAREKDREYRALRSKYTSAVDQMQIQDNIIKKMAVTLEEQRAQINSLQRRMDERRESERRERSQGREERRESSRDRREETSLKELFSTCWWFIQSGSASKSRLPEYPF